MKKYLYVLIPLILCVVISTLFVMFGKVSYDSLITPKFSPPSFVFIIAWSIIYILFYLVMIKVYDSKRVYDLYIAILISHIMWNMFYFGLGLLLIGLIILIIMYLISFVFAYHLLQIKKKYFIMTVPYLLWLLVALYLNFATLMLN